MKKLFIIFILLGVISGHSAIAQTNCEEFKCKEEYGLTPAYSRFFSRVTGNNFLTEKIAQILIKKNIKKTAQGDFKVKLKSYSARDMRAGRFKSFEIYGKNINIEDVYLSTFDLKTICNFNYLYIDKDWNMTVIDDLPMTFNLSVTPDDLNKTMKSENYTRLLNDINKLGSGIFTVTSTNLKIKNDKLYYSMKIALPFVRGTQDFVMCAGVKVQNGDIKFADAQILNRNFAMNVDKISQILNYINPLDFSVKILENKDAKLTVKNVSIADNKILADGTIVLLKDVVKK